MLRSLLFKATTKHNIHLAQVNCRRAMHTRNKKAMELIAKGWSALKEVDRVIDYCELNDKRLIPLLRTAKENFELALETDNSNTHARFWLAKLHLKYHVPGACKAVYGISFPLIVSKQRSPWYKSDFLCEVSESLVSESLFSCSSLEGAMNLEWRPTLSLYRKTKKNFHECLHGIATKEIDSVLPRPKLWDVLSNEEVIRTVSFFSTEAILSRKTTGEQIPSSMEIQISLCQN